MKMEMTAGIFRDLLRREDQARLLRRLDRAAGRVPISVPFPDWAVAA